MSRVLRENKLKKQLTKIKKGAIISKINKTVEAEKRQKGLLKRADYGVSSVKYLCIIWAAEGSVKCADARLA